MWNVKKRMSTMPRDPRKAIRASDSKSSRSRKPSSSIHHYPTEECAIDIPLNDQSPSIEQPSTKPTKAGRIRKAIIPCGFVICQFAIGLLFSIDMLSADGMFEYAVAASTITMLGALIGLRLEIMIACGKSTEEMKPAFRASILVDLLPSILLVAIMNYGPNCACVTPMVEVGSAAMWMMLITLVNSVRKLATIVILDVGKEEGSTVLFSLVQCMLTLFCGVIFFASPKFHIAEANVDCSRDIAMFRITAHTEYPIADFKNNNTESRFTRYQLETMIDANFTTAQLLEANGVNIKADCRRLAGFDQFLGTERDENCSLTASTINPNHDDDGDQALEFSLNILIGSSGGVVRSVPFCPQQDADADDLAMSLDYRPNQYELQKLFRAYCRIGSNETVSECPSMKTTTKMDESPIAWFNCTRMCFARPSMDQQKKKTIGFKQLVGRLIVGEKKYELKYKKSPLCW